MREILFSRRVALNDEDSPEQIAAKVLKYEHKYYASIIDSLLFNKPFEKIVDHV